MTFLLIKIKIGVFVLTNNQENYVKLITSFDEFNLNSIIDLLKDSDIPYKLTKDNSEANLEVINEINLSSTTILVPQDFLLKAQEIINLIFKIDFNSNI
ncbi:hypothetical protein EF514_04825 [Anaerosphaera multitolerans]|uniref:Uncharacterized protein n=1 Tax=Anaerosphaera multitolerans TaxID=2487351 RepID=A0A437S7E0_9FIRM|nr:hypothetical protein EF514_04825 [Anaerosphaera multitolerans]